MQMPWGPRLAVLTQPFGRDRPEEEQRQERRPDDSQHHDPPRRQARPLAKQCDIAGQFRHVHAVDFAEHADSVIHARHRKLDLDLARPQ